MLSPLSSPKTKRSKQINEDLHYVPSRPTKTKIAFPETNCTQKCPVMDIPNMPDRPKLKPTPPDRPTFNRWGQNHSQLFVWTEDIKYDSLEEKDLIQESKDHIQVYWEKAQYGLPMKLPTLKDFQIKNPSQKVPEIYHYTWISCHDFSFAHYISLYSVLKNMINPEYSKIIITTNCPPKGKWFDKIKKIAGPGRILVHTISANNNRIWFDKDSDSKNKGVLLEKIVHVSDIIRIMLLTKYGGIFLDDDHILLKPLDKYLELDVPTFGVESSASVQNCFQISPPDSTIYYRWLQEYKKYENIKMGIFSVMKLWALWQKYPEEINTVQTILVRPNWQELRYLDDVYFDWSEHYSMHLSVRYMKTALHKKGYKFGSEEDLECIDNVFGEVTRFTLFGRYERC